jgi:hypothetical protein
MNTLLYIQHWVLVCCQRLPKWQTSKNQEQNFDYKLLNGADADRNSGTEASRNTTPTNSCCGNRETIIQLVQVKVTIEEFRTRTSKQAPLVELAGRKKSRRTTGQTETESNGSQLQATLDVCRQKNVAVERRPPDKTGRRGILPLKLELLFELWCD